MALSATLFVTRARAEQLIPDNLAGVTHAPEQAALGSGELWAVHGAGQAQAMQAP